jgi:hypothetical protein
MQNTILVYFNWNDGNPEAAAFGSPTKAAEYVIERIEECIGVRVKKPFMAKRKPKSSATLDDYLLIQQPIYGGGNFIIPPVDFQYPPIQQAPNQAMHPIAPAHAPLPPPPFTLLEHPTPTTINQRHTEETPELAALKTHLQTAKANKTLDNARKVIDLYNEYAKYVLGITPVLHVLQEVRVENANV